MIENPSYRYYLVNYQFVSESFDILSALEKLLDAQNVCSIDEGLIFVRSKGKGRNGEFIYNEIKKDAAPDTILCVTTIGIRTFLGQNLPKRLHQWADFEIDLATPASEKTKA